MQRHRFHRPDRAQTVVTPVRRIFVITDHLVSAALDMNGLLMQTHIREIGDHNMIADLNGRSPQMAHDMAGLAGALMIVMMIVMGGFSLAFLARAVPAAWRGRIRHAARRLASPPAATGKEGTR
jgi:hypothetical protein